MEAALIALIFGGQNVPSRIVFNDCGVALNYLQWVIKYPKIQITFKVLCLDGKWGGAVDIMSTLWGCASPIDREHCVFPTFHECMKHLWEDAMRPINQNKELIGADYNRVCSIRDKEVIYENFEEHYGA